MILYHGSNVEVENPKIINKENKTNDFGEAFYLTSNKRQASKFAKIEFARRKGEAGTPIVNQYWFDEARASELTIVRYDKPTEEWLDFVVECRRGNDPSQDVDIIYGPVADDKVYRIVLLYERGLIGKADALERMLVNPVYTQYAFKTEKALSLLKFLKAKEVSK